MWWKQNKWKVIVPAIIVLVLAGAFWYGGNAPGLQGWSVKDPVETPVVETMDPAESAKPSETPEAEESIEPTESPVPSESVQPTESPEPAESEKPAESAKPVESKAPAATPTPAPQPTADTVASASQKYSEEHGMVINPETGKDKYLTDPVPEGKPLPVEPQDVTISDVAHTCTLSISCKTILNNMGWLDPAKVELVPEDGIILPATQVTFYEGESVFNVLQRTCKQQKIHMEFEDTPIYNSAYIEGIHNLYEFDCGELSGWMYCVNGWFPNYGVSRYQLQEGDVIEFHYTCDLGKDVGAGNAIGG